MAVFGRRQPQSFTELKETMRPTPDADGVTRVFSKELWDDPKIGNFLREVGFAPDDARNILPKAEDYIALFAAAKKRLDERAETRAAQRVERRLRREAMPGEGLGVGEDDVTRIRAHHLGVQRALHRHE